MVVRNKAKAKTVELTFNHEDNVNSITPEIIELERIFVWLVNNVVPPPYRQAMAKRQYVITTGYNDNRRKAKVGAYFAKDSWKILSDGTPVHAIHMFGNAFALDTIQLVTLLAHETVHAANHANGIQDCTKDRHTKPFQSLAVEMLMTCTQTDKAHGFNNTQPTAELEALIIGELQVNTEVFRKAAEALPPIEAKPKEKTRIGWTCGCTTGQFNVKTVVDITCNSCGNKFVAIETE